MWKGEVAHVYLRRTLSRRRWSERDSSLLLRTTSASERAREREETFIGVDKFIGAERIARFFDFRRALLFGVHKKRIHRGIYAGGNRHAAVVKNVDVVGLRL